MDNYKYYFAQSKSDDTYPLVYVNLIDYRRGATDKVEVELRNPIPRKPVMCDFHVGNKDIFHKRIADVMKSFDIEGVEFLPAEIDDGKGNFYDDYVCVVVDDNTYEALDKEESIYEYRNRIYRIQKLVLDKNALEKIPFEKTSWYAIKRSSRILPFPSVCC